MRDPGGASPDRYQRLCAALADRGLDGALLIGPGHVAHLCGGYQRVWSGPHAVFVDARGRRTLFVPIYEVEPATRNADADEVVGYGEPHFGLDLDPFARMAEVLAPYLRGRAVGLDSELPGFAETGIEATSLGSVIHDIRLVKDRDEQGRIARSFELAVLGADAAGAASREGGSEIELYTLAQAAAQRAAGAPIEFGADLLVGERTALVCGPVATPGARMAAPGDVVVADVSVRHGGYWGDTARTFAPDDSDAGRARAVLEAVLEEAATMLQPGVRASAVYAFIAEAIAARLPGASFPHHGGHGVGITPFEDPHIIPSDGSLLESGMVIALEPGAYLERRFGVRVEAMFVVTPAGGVDMRRSSEITG
jgi:Xaa-Pro aminopeptidase